MLSRAAGAGKEVTVRTKKSEKLEEDVAEAIKRGMTYGQMQAEKAKQQVKVPKAPDTYTSYAEREEVMKKEIKAAPTACQPADPVEVWEPTEPKIPMAVKAFVSVRISELEKELAELKEFKAGYSKCV